MSEEKNWYDRDVSADRDNKNSYGVNKFATASFVCGIVTLVLLALGGVLAIPSAALGIMFAILATRMGQQPEGKARRGLIMCICGLIFGIIITAYSIVTIERAGGVVSYLENEAKQVYGDDFDINDYLELDDYSSFEDYLGSNSGSEVSK